jgi:hypothetical protein
VPVRVLIVCLSGLLWTSEVFSDAAERPRRLEIWDLQLGASVDQLPDEFIEYACGTAGGPPSRPLEGWRDFMHCRPEASGLREVHFRYDDELEYWAKANNLLAQMQRYAGTKTYGFPIVTSALISPEGILSGLRIVSDPRAEDRDEAYLLRNFLNARLGREGWQCEDSPPSGGEAPVGGIFVKQHCRKQVDGTTTASLTTRYLRKPGQSQFDPRSGRETKGQFESGVRFELVRDK